MFIALKGDDQFPADFSSLGRQTSARRGHLMFVYGHSFPCEKPNEKEKNVDDVVMRNADCFRATGQFELHQFGNEKNEDQNASNEFS